MSTTETIVNPPKGCDVKCSDTFPWIEIGKPWENRRAIKTGTQTILAELIWKSK